MSTITSPLHQTIFDFTTKEAFDQTWTQISQSNDPNVSLDTVLKLIQAQDEDGDTPIHVAIKLDNLHCLKTMLCNIDPRVLVVTNNDGDTPLDTAIGYKRSDMINMLIRDETVLHAAVQQKSLKSVKSLLKDSDVRTLCLERNVKGYIPLELAAINESVECIELLFETEEGRQSATMQRDGGHTAFNIAMHRHVIGPFLKIPEGRECLTIQSQDGNVPLHYCYMTLDYSNYHDLAIISMMKRILETKEGRYSLTCMTTHFETPLHAMVSSHIDTSRLIKLALLTKEGRGACLMRDSNGRTPLLLAFRNGTYNEVEAILQSPEGRASCLIVDNQGCVPLHSGSRLGKAKLLLSTKEGHESCLIKDNTGSTPLMSAVLRCSWMDDKELVKMIMNTVNGRKSLRFKDNSGMTVMDYAERYHIGNLLN
jgi:ankyrin repeat protein